MKPFTEIPLLRAFGAKVYVHWSAFLIMGIILAACFRHPIIGIVSIFSYFLLIYLHEIGHAYFAKRLGCRPLYINIFFLHGHCYYQQPEFRKHDCIIAWGGVVAQLVVAIPLIILAITTDLTDVPGMTPVVVILGYLSVFIAAINLTPKEPADGSKAWSLFPILLAERRKPKKSGKVTQGPWRPNKNG